MEISVGIGGTVCGNQQVGAIQIRGVDWQKLDLYGEIPQPAGYRVHTPTGRTGTAPGVLFLLCLFRSQNSSFIIGRRFPFLNLAELGIGTAISYVLYKPLADSNRFKINEIVSVLGYLKTVAVGKGFV